MRRVRTIIKGRVQGVWFRQSTADEATRLGLRGWARNLADGAVEAVFEGDAGAVETMLAWAKVGPPMANVTSIDLFEETPTGEPEGFTVKR